MSVNQLWFVRHQGKVLGQFPLKEIQQGLVSGEIVVSDEISPDQSNWLPLSQFPGLSREEPPPQPSEELDEESRKWHEERVKAALRWEADPALHAHPGHLSRPSKLLKWLSALLALAAVVGLGGFLAWQWQEAEVAPQPQMLIAAPLPACDSAAGPKINWAGCDKSGTLLHDADLSGAKLSGAKFNSTDMSNSRLGGANLAASDLSYATLNGANLSGANLEGANLNFAELRDADLSQANLRNANLADAVLDGAKLDGATWVDGKMCAVGSLGQCL
ncbi:MAG: pentapeptide repeat-containing protein [Sulfuricella sp.]|nr:pentapeptide repeat-containing protein [Sulfuricella sp.]